MSLLHLYGQSDPHAEAWVVGDKEGLLALRKAIDDALASDESSAASAEVYVSDGEGYKVLVVATTEEAVERHNTLLPYSNAIYGRLAGRKHPLTLIGPSRYRELHAPPQED